MRTILATFLTVLLLFPVSAIGEIQTITHTVKQAFGGSQSADDARIAAVAKAKREALEMAGVYIEALTIVKDAKVDKDEVLALTAGVLKAEVISQKNYVSGDGFGIEIVAKIIVDQSILEARIKKMFQDKTHIDQLKRSQAREKGLLDKIAKLEKENQQLTRKGKSTQKLKKEFQQASRGLTAEDWFNKALALWHDKKCTDPKMAIEYLNEAIRLLPDFAEAFGNRGIAYWTLGQYARALTDYDELIRLKPDDAQAFYVRGIVYGDLGQHTRAITDFDTAIHLKPDYAAAFNNRGIAYADLGQYARALKDFDAAIRLKPDDPQAFYNRGTAYTSLGQYVRAIAEYDEAIRLKPDYADAYCNRGTVYALLGQYIQAIADFDELIRLKPDFAEAFGKRGHAYWQLGQHTRAIADYDVLIRLNPDDAQAFYSRGIAFADLDQYTRAIADYDTAIRLKPDFADAFNNRGTAYILSVKPRQGCQDLQTACGMGTCKGLEYFRSQRICR